MCFDCFGRAAWIPLSESLSPVLNPWKKSKTFPPTPKPKHPTTSKKGLCSTVAYDMKDEGKDILPNCTLCGKACRIEELVTDSKDRAMHKECYRAALISGRVIV
jgi:hypothetical protein